MSADQVRHLMSFAVSFVDHFGGEPVADELPVRLAGSFARPAPAPGGRGYRQADGSYRFVNVAPGPQRLLWREPFKRSEAGWLRWYDPEPELVLPLANPAQPQRIELWPAPSADPAKGAVGVRGKLAGPNAGALEVRLVLQGLPLDRFTCTDAAGEFLFPLSGRLPLNNAGRIPLEIAVQATDGTPRLLAGGAFIPAATGASFGADQFEILPGQFARIRFNLT